MNCPVQSNDRYFAQQTMDYLRIPDLFISSVAHRHGYTKTELIEIAITISNS